MKPAYEKVAQAFKSESDCVVAQMNADEESNRPISGKYGVTSFPTIQFFPKGGDKPIPYNLGRNEDQFVEVGHPSLNLTLALPLILLSIQNADNVVPE